MRRLGLSILLKDAYRSTSGIRESLTTIIFSSLFPLAQGYLNLSVWLLLDAESDGVCATDGDSNHTNKGSPEDVNACEHSRALIVWFCVQRLCWMLMCVCVCVMVGSWCSRGHIESLGKSRNTRWSHTGGPQNTGRASGGRAGVCVYI